MSLLEKLVYSISILVLLLAVALGIAYWWSGQVPRRPSNVHADAVFLWAPAVGAPAPRRGCWFSCWVEERKDICELDNIDGSLEYKGEFVSYAHEDSRAAGTLRIDSARTGNAKVWVGQSLVPLAYLQNGEILIPAAAYDQGVQLIKDHQNLR